MKKAIRILLVEDEVITAMLLQQELHDFGYPILGHVTTGEKAIIFAQENFPDIILMDIALSGEIDGIEAAAAIKAKADIPVIFMTGYDDIEMKERAAKTKPLGYLIKPFDVTDLINVIKLYNQ
jgi:two-component system, response regulator PdtaR